MIFVEMEKERTETIDIIICRSMLHHTHTNTNTCQCALKFRYYIPQHHDIILLHSYKMFEIHPLFDVTAYFMYILSTSAILDDCIEICIHAAMALFPMH